MTTKPIDTFILNSVSLFNVNPSHSIISITYQPPAIPNDSNGSQVSGSKLPRSKRFGKVTFKTSNHHLSSNYKFITNKNKDVSRLLNAIGSNGVSIKPQHILKKRINQKRHKSSSSKDKKKISNYSITGLATLLANNKIPKYDSSIINNNKNNNKSINNNDSTVSKKKIKIKIKIKIRTKIRKNINSLHFHILISCISISSYIN
ncbi:signal recognition particle subunit SRP21 PWA37_001253 [Arxiozyma heterogenica]|uniref:signal recognition particle subunit SRP21 n=1 Tax=Arxiozyma heterogenica TaxID=278026 RepID=UPI002EE30687